jgi:hypothetical protein
VCAFTSGDALPSPFCESWHIRAIWLRRTFFIDLYIVDVSGTHQTGIPEMPGRQQCSQIRTVSVIEPFAKQFQNSGAGLGTVGIDDQAAAIRGHFTKYLRQMRSV